MSGAHPDHCEFTANGSLQRSSSTKRDPRAVICHWSTASGTRTRSVTRSGHNQNPANMNVETPSRACKSLADHLLPVSGQSPHTSACPPAITDRPPAMHGREAIEAAHEERSETRRSGCCPHVRRAWLAWHGMFSTMQSEWRSILCTHLVCDAACLNDAPRMHAP